MMKRNHFSLGIGLLGLAVLLSACGGTKVSPDDRVGTGEQATETGDQLTGTNIHIDQLSDFSISPFKLSEVFTVEEHQEEGRPNAWTLRSSKYGNLYLSNDDTMISNEGGKSYFSSLPDEAKGYELGDGELLLIPFQWRPSGRWTEDVNYIYNLKTKKGFYLSKPCIGTNGFKQLEGSLVQSEIATTKSVFDEDMENVTFVGYCDLSKYQHGAKKKKTDRISLDPQDFSMITPQKHYGTPQEEVVPILQDSVEQGYYDDAQTPGVVKAGASCERLDRNQEQWESHLASAKKKRVCDKLVFEKRMKKKDACESDSYVDEQGVRQYYLKMKAQFLNQFDRPEEKLLVEPCNVGYKMQIYDSPDEEFYSSYHLVDGYSVYAHYFHSQDDLSLYMPDPLKVEDSFLASSPKTKKLYLLRDSSGCRHDYRDGLGNMTDDQREDESDADYKKRMRDNFNEYVKDQGEDELYSQAYECRLVDNK